MSSATEYIDRVTTNAPGFPEALSAMSCQPV